MGIHMMFVKELQDLIAELRLEVERLKIENRLLRASSEEHRELNGKLRQSLQQWQLGQATRLKDGM